MFSLQLHLSEPAGVHKAKLMNSPVPQDPTLLQHGFEGDGGNSYTGHLSLPQRPDGYSSPPGYLLTENITFEGQMCEPAHLNITPNTSLPSFLACIVFQK